MNSLLLSIIFWIVLFISFRTYDYFERWLEKRQGQVGKMTFRTVLLCTPGLLLLSISVTVVTHFTWVEPTKEKTKEEFYGTPIMVLKDFEGKIFTPQAFVVTNQHILLYDKDGKVYTLDWVQFDGLKPEELQVADNISYTIYRKGNKLFFGKL